MTQRPTTYYLKLDIESGILPFVVGSLYKPVAELLDANAWDFLPDDKVNEWIEINDEAQKVRLRQADTGGKPSLVLGEDGKTRFDLAFEGPRAGSKTVFCYIHPHQEINEDDETQIEINKKNVFELEHSRLNTIINVSATGELALGDDILARGLRSANSIGLVLETKALVFFWLVDTDPERPLTLENWPDFNTIEPNRTLMLTPGTARLRKPCFTGTNLPIRIWLEGATRSDIIIAEYQTEKFLVRYEYGEFSKKAFLNDYGHWQDQPVRTERIARVAPVGQQAAQTPGSTNVGSTLNGTVGKTALNDPLKGRTLQTPLSVGGFRR